MKRSLATILLCSFILSACKEDPEQAANKLFVETSTILGQYQALGSQDAAQYEVRLKLLNQVRDNLEVILSDYAESSLAVELASTGSVKNIDSADVEHAILVLEQSIPASALLAESTALWEKYIKLPQKDPSQYEARLDLLKTLAPNLDKLLKDYPLSYEAAALNIDAEAVKKEIDRIAQSIPASALVAATVPLWEQYQDLPQNDPTHYDTQLKLLAEIVPNLEKLNNDYPLSYEATKPKIDRLRAQKEWEEIAAKVQCAKDFSACAIATALEEVGHTIDESERTNALSKIATAQAVMGDSEGAKSTIATALATAHGAEDLVSVALAQIYIGQTQESKITISEALKAAGRIQFDPPRVHALSKIATAQAVMGDSEGAKSTIATALKMAQGMANGLPRVEALSDLAMAQAASGALRDAATSMSMALQSAKDINIDTVRVKALEVVLNAQMVSGDAMSANYTLNISLEYIDKITMESVRSEALSVVAKLQAEHGDISGALETANKIRHYTYYREEVLSTISIAQARIGEIESSLSTVEGITKKLLRDKANAVLAGALAGHGDILKGFELAESITDSAQRVEAFVEISLAVSKGK